MKRHYIQSALFCAFVVLFPAARMYAQHSSNGTGGGDWNDTNSWLSGLVPNNTSSVLVRNTDTITISNGATASCAQIEVVSGGTLALLGTGKITVENGIWNFVTGAHLTADAGTTVTINNFVGGADFTTNTADAFGNLQLNIPVSVSSMVSLNQAITAEHIAITGSTSQFINFGLLTNTVSSVEFNVQGNISFKAAPKTGAFFTVAGGASSNGTIEIITTNSITLAPVSPITANGAITIDAGGSTAPIQTGNDIIIGADTTITSSNGAVILKGNIASPAAPPTPYDLNISAASTITISGHIGANAYPFCTDILSLTAPTINLYNNIYTTNATNSSTTAITGSAVYIPTTPFTVSTHTLNIPAPNSLTAAAASSFTIQTDDFTGVTGTINAGTGSSSLTLFPLSSTRNVILGNTGFVSGVLDYVFFNTSIFGTGAAGGARIIASQFFIGDGNAAFGDIYVTDIGSAGGRFDCPLDMRAAIDKKIIFKNDIYMSKRLRADGSNTSIISFDNTLTINTTGDFMCYKPADINTTYAVTIESLNMMFLASITGGTSTKLTLTNSGGLSLYGNVNIGELLQNGQGNCSIPSSSPIMIKTVKGIRFASSIELQSTGTKLTFETTNPADGTVVLAGNITSNAANCEIYFKVAADITVNGAIGTAARKFREVAIAANPVVRNVTFDGIVYANNYTQDGGSGYTWFKSDINYSIDNFAFTGMQLTTKMLKCNGIITIANSDIWRSGNWDYAGATWNLPAGGGADITGASIYQSGTGDCYLSGRLIANANIAFSGNIHIYTDTLNIRNAGESGASSLGTISLAGLRRGSSYVGNVSIQTGTETAANTVAISGTIGESGTPLGIVEIAHAGTLKLGPTTPTTGNAIDIYVQRFHQKTSSADTELNVQMLSAAGSQGDLTSGMGGIVFMGKTVLKRMGTITFKTHNITNNGKSIIHFEGAVVGGSNILIEDSYAAITFNGAIGSTGAVLPAPGEKIGRPASAPTNTYDTYALEIRNIHSSSGDITINGPIYAGGPIWLHPNFSTSHTVTIKGDILIDEYTYNFPNDLSTKIHAASTLINVERIIVGNSIEFRYPLSFDFSPPNEAPRLRIESTSSGGTIFLQDDIISARNGIELVTQETGFVTIKKIMSVASSTASNPAEPTDYLYIKTGTLKFDNTSSYNIHTGGFHGTRRIVRFVVKKKIDFQNSSTPVLLYAANGKGDIYIQPWNADQPLYFYTADFSAPADSNGLYIHARLFAAMRAKRVFFGSPNTTSNPPTHGYMVNPLDVNNLTIWNGTGSFHLGGGNLPLASTVSGPFTGSDQTSENMYDLYMFTNGLLINFLFGNTAYEGINLFRPKNFFIYAPNAQIISNRTPTSSGLEYADITVKSYIQANETIEGTVFFKVKSIGTAGYPLVINTPNMGSASGIAADITESMYVKNIYYQQPGSGGVKIWKIQSSDTANGTVAINNANSGIEQPAQAGGIAAQHLHIKAANDINLTTNNAIEKTATLESESTNTNNITFTNSAAGNLVLSAKNTGAGSITITENSGSLTIDALSRPAMVGGSLAGVEGAGGTIVLQPKTGSALYIGQSSPSAPADVVVKSNVGGPGGSIFFNAPVLSGSTTHPHNLTLAAGTSRMQFFQYVGALPGASPSSYNTASHLGTVKIESGTVTKTTGSDFFIAANSLELGTAGGAVALIDTSGDQVKHITLRVNGLVKNTGSNIKAGDNVIPRPWGRFKIYPLTAAYTVQYAPTSTPGYDVYYSSSWPDIIAESFTVGDAAHLANITIDSVTATLFELAVQNGGTASIIIKNDYTSVNKPLTMQSGSGGIVLEGDSTLAGPASVTLGTAGFTASSRFTLKHLTTGTITARGGITLGEVTADTQTASSGDANLILNAGTSPVSITGNIGTNTGAPNASSRLGAFTIASSGQITLGGSLYTSGNITLAVSDANRNIQLTSTGQTEISSGSGMFMLSGNAALTHANGLFLNTLFNGASSPVELTLNAAAAGNTVTLKSGGDYAMQTNAGRLIFAGKSQTLNANGATLPGQTRLAMDAAAAVTLVSSDVRQSIGELHIQSGKLDLNGQKWGLGVSPAGGFLADGASSSLVMAANTALTTQGGFTVQNGAALNLDPASKIAFSNTTPQSLNVPAAAQLGSIEIAANAALTLASAIIVTGSWAQLGGRNTFDHNDQTVTFSGARLHDIRVGDANTAAADREIIWKRLIAQTPGMTLRFDNWPAKHTVLDELRIEGAVGSPITLTRLTGGVTPPSSRPTDLAAGTAAHNGFWYLDPPNSGGVISVKDLYVEYSFVKKDEPIEPPLNVSVTPYYTTAQNVSSHYTVNWLRRNVFIYTWAEDANGNGQIDRLRAQMPPQYPPQGDISNFKPIVEGYETTGCAWVPGYGPGGANAADGYMLYIKLAESGLPDTGAVPRWRVDDVQLTPEGAAVWVMAGSDKLPLDVYDAMKTIDTAPPRIAYTLSVPGKNEVYVKMSEPIAAASLSGLSGGTFGKAINSAQNVSESELLLTTAASFTAEELLSSIYADAAFAAVTDKAANLLPGDPFAHKEPVPPLYPSHYAADVQHSASPTFIAVINNYEESPFPSNYSGFITQANKYTSKTGEHRASDLLVLRPSRTQPELILWPIYAKDASGRSHSRDDGGIGTAVKYNGSEKLRPTGSGGGVTDQPGILVEAAGNPFIQGGAPPQILYAFDVESKYRQLQQTETTPPELGVWLPQLSADDPANNLTPRPLTAAEDGSTQNGTSYYFRVSDREVAGHTTLEFIFKIGGLYAVRLDAPDGSIPTGWYHRLRTFAVNFQDLQRQRGGVTVLNNVINPVKGEIAALNYRITRGGQVTIQVFTMDGVLVKQLERAGKSSGDYTVSWDGKNEGGRPVARGMYFIRAVAPDIDEIRKVMVVK